ncbi:hypothetical protein M422DRAFT_242104 [Sphaerobolus stellatus SS14]|nr:hypothetical protein M422DRAFT_242104 [Sphaerobolus stellatus SS14]
MFRINEYVRSLPGLPRNLVARHDDPDWKTKVIQSFNVNPSGVPRNLQLEGLHVNVDDADIWYWVNLIKPKYHGAEAEMLLQYIFSSMGRWDQLVAGQWKKNDSPYLITRSSIRATSPTGWASYFIRCSTWMIWNEVTLRSQLWANEIASLKGGIMNQFRVHDDLLPLVRESLFYFPPSVGEPPPAGSSSLADRLDYGEGGSFSCPPADARELRACISYYDSLVPQGTARESTAELTEELTHNLYADNLE